MSKRRRPSGEPPPLPRAPGFSRWLWAAVVVVVLGVILGVACSTSAAEDLGASVLRWFEGLRTSSLTDVAEALSALTNVWVVLALRVVTVLILAATKRWRHLVVFLALFVITDWIAFSLLSYGRPAPTDLTTIGEASDFAFPSPGMSALSVTLFGMGAVLAPAGRPRDLARGIATILSVLVAVSIA